MMSSGDNDNSNHTITAMAEDSHVDKAAGEANNNAADAADDDEMSSSSSTESELSGHTAVATHSIHSDSGHATTVSLDTGHYHGTVSFMLSVTVSIGCCRCTMQ